MSDSDSFIREVSEEVRRDRMFRLWKKYGPWVIAAIVLVIAGAAALNWWQHHQRETARELGGAFLGTDIASVADQERLLERVDGAAEPLARLRLAAAHAESGNAGEAARLYREIAGNSGLDPAFADLARLQAVRLDLPDMAPSEAVAELEPLAAEGAPYRLLALELRATAHLEAGNAEAAHADLRRILESQEATRDITERAAALLVASGGELPSGADTRGEI